MLGSPCTRMVMHLTSGVGLGIYRENRKRNSIFEKSSYWVTQFLNCRVSKPPSHQQISEDITRPLRIRVFKLTRSHVYQVMIDYPHIRAHAHVCLFQFWIASLCRFWKRKLESEQVLGVFLLNCILISTDIQLWPPYYLLWHFSPDRYISTVITLGFSL